MGIEHISAQPYRYGLASVTVYSFLCEASSSCKNCPQCNNCSDTIFLLYLYFKTFCHKSSAYFQGSRWPADKVFFRGNGSNTNSFSAWFVVFSPLWEVSFCSYLAPQRGPTNEAIKTSSYQPTSLFFLLLIIYFALLQLCQENWLFREMGSLLLFWDNLHLIPTLFVAATVVATA